MYRKNLKKAVLPWALSAKKPRTAADISFDDGNFVSPVQKRKEAVASYMTSKVDFRSDFCDYQNEWLKVFTFAGIPSVFCLFQNTRKILDASPCAKLGVNSRLATVEGRVPNCHKRPSKCHWNLCILKPWLVINFSTFLSFINLDVPKVSVYMQK